MMLDFENLLYKIVRNVTTFIYLQVMKMNANISCYSGTWSCGLCTREVELKISTPIQRPVEATGSKRKMPQDKLLPEELRVSPEQLY